MFGLLNINKPTGITSRRVVDQVQRLVRPAKAGHAGTLDPLARGVLIVAVGPATRLVDYLHRQSKQYRAVFLLGRTSDTEDLEGQVTELTAAPIPTAEQLQTATTRFIGTIRQRPPAYSALKVQGRRAYQLARRGAHVELAPREVTIHQLSVVDYDYPQLTLDVECGAGTYVRSLGRDLAESLGTAAVMSELTRTAIGDFLLDDAVAPDALDAGNLARHLLSPLLAVADLPQLLLTVAEADEICHGRPIHRPQLVKPAGTEFAAAAPGGDRLLAILEVRDDRQLHPRRVFHLAPS